MSGIRPFRIDVPESDIQLLYKKLDLTRLPAEIEDAGWELGAPL
jgi:hypothetical protein